MGRTYQMIKQTKENGYPEFDVSLDEKFCPYCGSGEIHVNSNMQREFNDVDEDGNYRKVNVHFARYKCKSCGKTFSPLPKSLVNSYTPEFREQVIQDYYGGKSTRELSSEYNISAQNIRKFIREYLQEWEGKNKYSLPETVGIATLNLKAGRFYALVDVIGSNVMDILSEENLLEEEMKGVKGFWLADMDVSSAVMEKLGVERVFIPHDIRLEDGLEALAKDAAELGSVPENLREILENADTATPYEEIVRFPRLMPVFLAAKSFIKAVKDESKVAVPNVDLKNFVHFLQSASLLENAWPLERMTDNELARNFVRKARKFREQAGDVPKSMNTSEKVKGKLLYSNGAQPSICDRETGEVLLDFGKRI